MLRRQDTKVPKKKKENEDGKLVNDVSLPFKSFWRFLQ